MYCRTQPLDPRPPPRTTSNPRLLPFPHPRPQHYVPVMYQSLPSLYSRCLKSKPGDDSDCWWASQRCLLPQPLPPPAARLGHRRPLDIQSHVTVWGPRTFGRRSVRVGYRLWQALTNYVRTSAGKCGYLYQLNPPPTPPTARWQNWSAARRWRRWEEQNKGADMKKEAKRATVWQHNHWASAELSCKRNSSFFFPSRPPPVMLLHCYVEASSRTAKEGAVREQRRGVNERWK